MSREHWQTTNDNHDLLGILELSPDVVCRPWPWSAVARPSLKWIIHFRMSEVAPLVVCKLIYRFSFTSDLQQDVSISRILHVAAAAVGNSTTHGRNLTPPSHHVQEWGISISQSWRMWRFAASVWLVATAAVSRPHGLNMHVCLQSLEERCKYLQKLFCKPLHVWKQWAPGFLKWKVSPCSTWKTSFFFLLLLLLPPPPCGNSLSLTSRFRFSCANAICIKPAPRVLDLRCSVEASTPHKIPGISVKLKLPRIKGFLEVPPAAEPPTRQQNKLCNTQRCVHL